jgi:hypothetical protein
MPQEFTTTTLADHFQQGCGLLSERFRVNAGVKAIRVLDNLVHIMARVPLSCGGAAEHSRQQR